MTEGEYSRVSDLTKLRAAMRVLGGVVPGDEYGINYEKFRGAMLNLHEIEVELEEWVSELVE